MRILAIRFQNLNSLRGEHVVDLESGPLAEAGLFAITGPTGSGKSTILDAITLALYARAARYGNDTAEDMMSRSAGECSASVEFLCESGRYTAKWTMRRSRGRADGKFQPVKHELSCGGVILEEKTRSVVTKIETLTGLDYDRFLRSVLLAQGQFAAFLKSGKDERADLLERITGSHLYSELGALAHQVGASQARDIKEASDRMSGIEFLPLEEREEMTQRLAALTKDLDEREVIRRQLETRVNAAKRAAELDRTAAELTASDAEQAGALEAFAPEEERLRRHAATLPFEPQLGELTGAENAAGPAENAAAESVRIAAAARLTAARAAGTAMTALEAAGTTAAVSAQAMEDRRTAAAAELATVRAWMEAHAADARLTAGLAGLSVLADRTATARSRSASAGQALAAAQLEAAAAEERASGCGESAAAAARHSETAAEAAAAAASTLAGLLSGPWTSLEALEAETARLQELTKTLQRLQTAQAALAEEEIKVTSLDAEVTALEIRFTHGTSAETTARTAWEAARREESLLHELVRKEQLIRSFGEHRQHLTPGGHCPLCGAQEHPWADPAAVPPADAATQRLVSHQQAMAGLQSASAEAAAALTASGKELAAAKAGRQARLESLTKTREDINREWQSHFPGSACTALSIETAAAEASARLDRAGALLTEVRRLAAAERAAHTAALRAAAAAQNAQTLASAARTDAAKARAGAAAAREALAAAADHLAVSSTALATALGEWGETSAVDPAAALDRLRLRGQNWTANQTAAAALENQLARLDHDLATLKVHAGHRAARGKEVARAVEETGLEPQMSPAVMDWETAVAAFARAATALHSADSLARAARQSAMAAAARVTAARESLESSLADGEFAGPAALRAARMEPAALTLLMARRDALRESGIQLAARRSAMEQDRESLLKTLATLMDPVRLPDAQDFLQWQAALATATAESHALRTEFGALSERLQADAAARARHAAAVAALESMKAAAAPWQRLGTLIGSATGDRFSRYAQSITLEHLVVLANARLSQLCDRYRLLRSGPASELQLQIADAWQADAVRPMESLSGGETFLISLALALGLSELAGRRTRIGTLFIDEGFGTLDTTALDVALSALEGLRTGHSTIGIISHVEALKARLTTQIEVTRGPGGWSTLHVRT